MSPLLEKSVRTSPARNRMGRLQFAIRILLNYGSDKNCPFCRSTKTDLIARKDVILPLRRCKSCGLMFRWPKEDPGFSERFYQDSYRQVGTTDLPDPVMLKTFIASNFAGAPRDIAGQIGVLKAGPTPAMNERGLEAVLNGLSSRNRQKTPTDLTRLPPCETQLTEGQIVSSAPDHGRSRDTPSGPK